MEQRGLGRSNIDLSVFGLGTMTFGDETDEATAHQILNLFAESGGTFIDTANVYSHGVSEEIIGRWLARGSKRDELVVATKARFQMANEPDQVGAGKAHLREALEGSLRRLGVETIDLYQIHAWDPATPIHETLETLNGFVSSGKVRAIGVSNFTSWQLQRASLTAQYEGWAPIVSLQPEYNLLSREIEWDLLPLCLDEGIGVLPWSPLGGGWLTGKYSPSARPTGPTRLGEDPSRGIEAYDIKNKPLTWEILGVVEGIARSHGVSMAQVALNWARNRPGITSVILGARNAEQLEGNLAALAWNLSDQEMDALNAVSAPGIPLYPYGFLESYAGVDVWEKLATRTHPPLATP